MNHGRLVDFLRRVPLAALPGRVSSAAAVIWGRLSQFERIVLSGLAVIATLVVLSYSWSEHWILGFHREWQITYAACALMVCLFIVVRLSSRQSDLRHSIEAMAASFTTLAILATGYWYFYERPGVPKINLTTAISVWPVGSGLAVARIETTIENVGSTVIEFHDTGHDGTRSPRDDRLKVDLGRVLPFDPRHESNAKLVEAALRAEDAKDLGIARTSHWPLLANYYDFSSGEIEAGETERYYYKAIVPCTDGMVLSSTVRIPKVGRLDAKGRNLVWLAQALSEPVENCRP